jgi:hypothetical protein
VSLLRASGGSVETTGDVILALSAGAAALRARAQRLADNPDADTDTAEGIIASMFEDASTLEQLAAELRA